MAKCPVNLRYDIPVEVTRAQYRRLTRVFPGAIAHRREPDKYYIKLWSMNYKEQVENLF